MDTSPIQAQAQIHIPALCLDPLGAASGPGVLRLADGEGLWALSWHPLRAARGLKLRISAAPDHQVRLIRIDRDGEYVTFAVGDMVWKVASHHATYVQAWADQAWSEALKGLHGSSQLAVPA